MFFFQLNDSLLIKYLKSSSQNWNNLNNAWQLKNEIHMLIPACDYGLIFIQLYYTVTIYRSDNITFYNMEQI